MIIELIDWNGGEMPVKKGTSVLVVHRDGKMFITSADKLDGQAYDWFHDDLKNDIIAYKVLE